MFLSTRGIIFRSIKYGETSLILDVYTESAGLQKYIIGGVRKTRSRFSPSLLQPMNLLHLVAYNRADREINRLKEVRPDRIYQRLPFEVRRSSVAQFITEVARKSIRQTEAHEALYDFLRCSYCYLDDCPQPPRNFHFYFLLHLSQFLGFAPSEVSMGPYFHLSEGIFATLPPERGPVLEPPQSALLARFLTTPIEELEGIQLTRSDRQALLLKLLDYYRLHIDNFPEIHSHLILREVLQ